jgi:hypothetical protein
VPRQQFDRLQQLRPANQPAGKVSTAVRNTNKQLIIWACSVHPQSHMSVTAAGTGAPQDCDQQATCVAPWRSSINMMLTDTPGEMKDPQSTVSGLHSPPSDERASCSR